MSLDKMSTIFGGELPASNLTLISTAAAGTSDYISFKTGSQVEALKIDTSGNVRLLKPMVPNSSDGAALGSASLMWSDLFLASGGVINWNNGDVTVTHSANTLAFAGASSGYTFDATTAVTGAFSATTSITATTSISAASVTGSMVAAQSDQETGTSTTTVVTPGRQHFHPSAAKGWTYAGVNGTQVVNYNVSSITDGGTGDMTVNWGTDFGTANYSPAVSAIKAGAVANPRVEAIAAGTTQISNTNSANAGADPDGYFVQAFGDFA